MNMAITTSSFDTLAPQSALYLDLPEDMNVLIEVTGMLAPSFRAVFATHRIIGVSGAPRKLHAAKTLIGRAVHGMSSRPNYLILVNRLRVSSSVGINEPLLVPYRPMGEQGKMTYSIRALASRSIDSS